MLYNLRQDSPLRPPDWRWQKAVRLVQDRRPLSRTRDDPAVERAVRFHTERERHAGDQWALLDVADRWPNLFDAHELYVHGDKARRSELEAWLLCVGSCDKAAARTKMKPDTVRWYETLFFNVTDRIDDRSWVAHQVIGSAVHEGTVHDRDYDVFWKLFGYGGGEYVLEALVHLFVDPTKPDSSGQVMPFFRTQNKAAVTKKAALQMLTLRCTDAYQKLQLGELAAKYEELEQAAKGGNGANDMVKDSLAGMLKSLPFGVGQGGLAASHVVAIGAASVFDRQAAEPRAAELLLERAGSPAPALPAAAQLAFPKPEGRP